MDQKRSPPSVAPHVRPGAFEDLYVAHAEWVLRLVWFLGVTGRERLDVAQEVWIVVFRKLASYDPARGSARAWLAGIARRTVRTWQRTSERRPEEAPHEVPEAADVRTPEHQMTQRETGRALVGFLLRAVPDPAQREALVLHVLSGLTLREVAEITEAPETTVQWRLKMARRNLEQAKQAMTDKERDEMRALLLPFATVDQIIEAMDPGVSDEEIATVWDGVSKRIAAEGGGPAEPESAEAIPPATPEPSPPARFSFTGTQLFTGALAVFAIGALVGAVGTLLWQTADRDGAAKIANLDSDRPLIVPPERAPDSTPPERTTAPLAPAARSTAPLPSEADLLLRRMRTALGRSPSEALSLVAEHGRRFPRENAAEREIVAIRALVRLGQQGEAQERAARLIQRSPRNRASAEAALGRSL